MEVARYLSIDGGLILVEFNLKMQIAQEEIREMEGDARFILEVCCGIARALENEGPGLMV